MCRTRKPSMIFAPRGIWFQEESNGGRFPLRPWKIRWVLLLSLGWLVSFPFSCFQVLEILSPSPVSTGMFKSCRGSRIWCPSCSKKHGTSQRHVLCLLVCFQMQFAVLALSLEAEKNLGLEGFCLSSFWQNLPASAFFLGAGKPLNFHVNLPVEMIVDGYLVCPKKWDTVIPWFTNFIHSPRFFIYRKICIPKRGFP